MAFLVKREYCGKLYRWLSYRSRRLLLPFARHTAAMLAGSLISRLCPPCRLSDHSPGRPSDGTSARSWVRSFHPFVDSFTDVSRAVVHVGWHV